MKNLLDIQKEIRRLENSVQDITDQIKTIDSAIEDLRDSGKNPEIDYEQIERLAGKVLFTSHPLSGLIDEKACQLYLEILLNIVRLDPDMEAIINRLIFVQWIQKQAQIEWSLEELFTDCMKMEKEAYYELLELLPKQYTEYLIVDALIVAYISGSVNSEILEYLGNLSEAFGIKKERLRILSLLSRAILCQNMNNMKDIDKVLQYAEEYGYYLNSEMVQFSIKSLRTIVVELPENEISHIIWNVKKMQMVEKGEVIATYKPYRRDMAFRMLPTAQEIIAPFSGIIYQFKYKHTYYGVIGHEKDDMDSIKEWIKTR